LDSSVSRTVRPYPALEDERLLSKASGTKAGPPPVGTVEGLR
jgi:hypothetical protein